MKRPIQKAVSQGESNNKGWRGKERKKIAESTTNSIMTQTM